jgi:hypothetical protein
LDLDSGGLPFCNAICEAAACADETWRDPDRG